MTPAQRAHIAACAATVGFALTYVACHFGTWPRLTYFQHAREWRVVADPTSSIPSAYVGILLWGTAGGVLAGILALAITRLRTKPLSPTWLRLFAAWAIAAFVLAAAYYTWHLLPR